MNKIDKAIFLASDRHQNVYRKMGGQPYICHPIEVMSLCYMITHDEDVLCACILHDLIEDTTTNILEISEEFGDRVAVIVAHETENKYPGISKSESWLKRKRDAIRNLSIADDPGAKIVCICDKVSNLRSMHMMQLAGEDVFSHFNQKDPTKHYWYYRSLRDVVSEYAGNPVYEEMCFLINEIFKGVEEIDYGIQA